MVIRYALKKALMDCQLWVSTEVKRGNQNFVVDRVKLPTDEGFGDLQPVDDPKSRPAEAEDDMKIKQEAPNNVDAADDTAPGEAAVTRGYYKTLTTIQDDTSLTYGSTYSEDNAPPPPGLPQPRRRRTKPKLSPAGTWLDSLVQTRHFRRVPGARYGPSSSKGARSSRMRSASCINKLNPALFSRHSLRRRTRGFSWNLTIWRAGDETVLVSWVFETGPAWRGCV